MRKGTFTDGKGDPFTIGRVRGLVVKLYPSIVYYTDFDDIIQEAAIALSRQADYPATTVVRSAVIDYFRKHGAYSRGGKPRVTRQAASLDVVANTAEDALLIDTIQSRDPSVEDIACQETLDDLLAPLSERERYIVIATSVGVDGITVGNKFGISESRVSQIRRVALDKIDRRHELVAA